MTHCTGCRRTVLVTWAIDGTAARWCMRCIGRALREADWQSVDRQVRALMRRHQP